MEPVAVDGSFHEGGGQIIRTAVSLSAVTGKPVRIFNIRKGRPKPGLQPQHLAGIEAVARLCGAEMKGARLQSTEVLFVPGGLETRDLQVDIGTAGATTLVLQSLLIPAARANQCVAFTIAGGTDVAWAPLIGYFKEVFSFFLQRMGIRIETEVLRRGFYPKGGGRVRVTVHPGTLKPLQLTDAGQLQEMVLCSVASKDLQQAQVAERQAEGARGVTDFGKAESQYVDSLSPGSSVLAVARCRHTVLGASALGERGKPAEQVGAAAARGLQEQLHSGACLDEWMADQILPFLALADGRSEVTVARMTPHAETNLWVIGKFLDVDVQREQKRHGVVVSVEPGQEEGWR